MTRRTRNLAALAQILGSLLMIRGGSALAEEPPRRLPEVIVRDICKAYEGKSAFDSKGETTTIDCDWVRSMAVISQTTPIETYRGILNHSTTLADLRTAKWPADIDCGNFDVQAVSGNLAVICTGDVGEKVPYVFFADANGRILRMETVLDYKRFYRDALNRAIARKKISRFYEAYVELNSDLMIAKLKFTASPLDSVRWENGRISIVMQASRKLPAP